jgi:hypothetical protein
MLFSQGKITPAPVTCLGNKEMNSDALTLAELCKDSVSMFINFFSSLLEL